MLLDCIANGGECALLGSRDQHGSPAHRSDPPPAAVRTSSTARVPGSRWGVVGGPVRRPRSAHRAVRSTACRAMALYWGTAPHEPMLPTARTRLARATALDESRQRDGALRFTSGRCRNAREAIVAPVVTGDCGRSERRSEGHIGPRTRQLDLQPLRRIAPRYSDLARLGGRPTAGMFDSGSAGAPVVSGLQARAREMSRLAELARQTPGAVAVPAASASHYYVVAWR